MIRAIVVDDEPLARGMIESYVKKTPFMELSGSFSNATDALEELRSGKVDVAFLDIQMPDMNGLELSGLIDGKTTKIVFITAFDKYAVDGFKVDAVDYLLKPVSYAGFLKAAGRVRERIQIEEAARNAASSAETKQVTRPTSIFIKSEYRMLQIEFSSIEYIESARDYVVIHTDDGQKLMTQMTLKGLEAQLPDDIFIRIHRSFLVNISKIKLIEQGCVIFGRTVIPISESAKDKFYKALSRNSVIS